MTISLSLSIVFSYLADYFFPQKFRADISWHFSVFLGWSLPPLHLAPASACYSVLCYIPVMYGCSASQVVHNKIRRITELVVLPFIQTSWYFGPSTNMFFLMRVLMVAPGISAKHPKPTSPGLWSKLARRLWDLSHRSRMALVTTHSAHTWRPLLEANELNQDVKHGQSGQTGQRTNRPTTSWTAQEGTAFQRKWSRGSNWKQRYRSSRHTARSAPLLAPCSAMCQRPQTSLVPGRSFRGGCFASATFCNNSTQPTTKNLWTERTNSRQYWLLRFRSPHKRGEGHDLSSESLFMFPSFWRSTPCEHLEDITFARPKSPIFTWQCVEMRWISYSYTYIILYTLAFPFWILFASCLSCYDPLQTLLIHPYRQLYIASRATTNHKYPKIG